jgi:hypothetical protein
MESKISQRKNNKKNTKQKNAAKTTNLNLGQNFQILSNGANMIIVLPDAIVVIDRHYLKSINTHIRENKIDVSPLEKPSLEPANKLTPNEISLNILVAGPVEFYTNETGKDLLKKFDLFKPVKMRDLLTRIRKELGKFGAVDWVD